MKPRLTDAEFDELKLKRDTAIAKHVADVCAEQGWDKATAHVHISHGGGCYCACPDGPCQHVWDGPEYVEENMSSVSCSRCGAPAFYHDMRCAP